MNRNSASAMVRLLSSEGWNEKSKPASVFMAERACQGSFRRPRARNLCGLGG
jgi:hypothetical protein